jgi:hypothetical protein
MACIEAEWMEPSGLCHPPKLLYMKTILGDAADGTPEGGNGAGNTSASNGGNTGATTSTSTGTSRDVRPRIDAELWAIVEAEALRRDLTPGVFLGELLGRLKSGRRRGDGAWTVQLKALDVLMRRVTLNLIRCEGALLDLIDLPSAGTGLVGLEAADYRDAQARLVISAIARLRRDVSQLRELLLKGSTPKEGDS